MDDAGRAALGDGVVEVGVWCGLRHTSIRFIVRRVMVRARDHFLAARRVRPRAALPAILPAALVPVYLRRMGKDVPIHRRQMALLSAAMRRKL